MSNGTKFVADITRWVNATKGAVDLVVRKVIFDLATAIVYRTPVDTGRLRGNWQFGDSVIPSATLSGTDAGGAGTLARMAPQINSVKAGGVAFIVNNLPYAVVIEYGLYPNPPKKGTGKTAGGFSTQAPQGMVRITVAEYVSYLNNAVISVRGG